MINKIIRDRSTKMFLFMKKIDQHTIYKTFLNLSFRDIDFNFKIEISILTYQKQYNI